MKINREKVMTKRYIPYNATEVVSSCFEQSTKTGDAYDFSRAFTVPQEASKFFLLDYSQARATINEIYATALGGSCNVSIYSDPVVSGFEQDGQPNNRAFIFTNKQQKEVLTKAYNSEDTDSVIDTGKQLGYTATLSKSEHSAHVSSFSSTVTYDDPIVLGENTLLFVFENTSDFQDSEVEFFTSWIERSYELREVTC